MVSDDVLGINQKHHSNLIMEAPKEGIKITLPVAVLLSAVVLAVGFYAVQYNKQQSIERQQAIEIMEDRKVAEAKTEVEAARAEKEKEDDVFNNSLRCQTLLKDLKERWNNVVGIYYSEWRNTCMVKYTKDGEVEEAAIEYMQDAQ